LLNNKSRAEYNVYKALCLFYKHDYYRKWPGWFNLGKFTRNRMFYPVLFHYFKPCTMMTEFANCEPASLHTMVQYRKLDSPDRHKLKCCLNHRHKNYTTVCSTYVWLVCLSQSSWKLDRQGWFKMINFTKRSPNTTIGRGSAYCDLSHLISTPWKLIHSNSGCVPCTFTVLKDKDRYSSFAYTYTCSYFYFAFRAPCLILSFRYFPRSWNPLFLCTSFVYSHSTALFDKLTKKVDVGEDEKRNELCYATVGVLVFLLYISVNTHFFERFRSS